jgi:hypothetical protein
MTEPGVSELADVRQELDEELGRLADGLESLRRALGSRGDGECERLEELGRRLYRLGEELSREGTPETDG